MEFITNKSFECQRSRDRDIKRADNYVHSYWGPHQGPVYVNRMKEPIVPEFELERRKNSLAGKINAFFTSLGLIFGTEKPNEAEDITPIPQGQLTEGEIAIIRSLEDSAVEVKPKRGKKVSSRAKRAAKKNNNIQKTANTGAQTKPEIQSITDIKDSAEAKARLKAKQKAEMIKTINDYLAIIPNDSVFHYLDPETLNDFSNKELEEIVSQIKSQMLINTFPKPEIRKKQWARTEEYLLFSDEINVKDFVRMLKGTGKNFISPVEFDGLVDWTSENNTSPHAGYRLGNDVVHNWNITNLKIALTSAYELACEDGGMLDHDPILTFPNGEKARLSKFVGEEIFFEIAENDAVNKDMAVLPDAGALKTA